MLHKKASLKQTMRYSPTETGPMTMSSRLRAPNIITSIEEDMEDDPMTLDYDSNNKANKLKWFKRNAEKWTFEVNCTYHDGNLDVYPVYRALNCTVASEYRD